MSRQGALAGSFAGGLRLLPANCSLQLLFGQAHMFVTSEGLTALPTPLLMEVVLHLRVVNEKQRSVVLFLSRSCCVVPPVSWRDETDPTATSSGLRTCLKRAGPHVCVYVDETLISWDHLDRDKKDKIDE